MKINNFSFQSLKNYGLIVCTLFLSWLLSTGAETLFNSEYLSQFEQLETIKIFTDIVIIFSLGFIAYELSKPTIIPSFVIALCFGVLSQNSLSFISSNSLALSILTTIGAILILFGGGLETPFIRFKSLINPIILIAFLGTIITAFLFSLSLKSVNEIFNNTIPLTAIILLGVSLASTDPAAIIPSFKSLLFNQPRVKHIAISESALNDVVGALITGIFLSLFIKGYTPNSLIETYQYLFTFENFFEIIKVIFLGIIAGFIGYLILDLWSKWKENIDSDGEADSALFLAVPIFTFTLALILKGNGFLAVFISGLLFQIKHHVKHVEHFFNHTIEGFMKPLIFMLLGTLVNFHLLQQYSLIGIVMGIIFMFIIRPITVFLTLSPFIKGKHNLRLKELIFLSFVRETGVIPAVLLVSIKVAGIPGSDAILAIGMWVIILTLILEPPFTPHLAKFLGIAKEIPPFPKQQEKGLAAVLCSRSHSFLDRLVHVVNWSVRHNIENVFLLHCPEDKYSDKFLNEIQELAEVKFKSINNNLINENKKEISFKFLGRPGFLEQNIKDLVAEGGIAIIFVGTKMLDYRLEHVKKLQVPFVFIE